MFIKLTNLGKVPYWLRVEHIVRFEDHQDGGSVIDHVSCGDIGGCVCAESPAEVLALIDAAERAERRERIATAVLAAFEANPHPELVEGDFDVLASMAKDAADALLAELEKEKRP